MPGYAAESYQSIWDKTTSSSTSLTLGPCPEKDFKHIYEEGRGWKIRENTLEIRDRY